MTEYFSLDPPVLVSMFAEGARNPLVVVDIFGDERGPLPRFTGLQLQDGDWVLMSVSCLQCR